ncbi:tetratricopeptide repeat protein [Candidatus Parcubacteria bacterium]|nr:MAG: tetratricopeptide repeat protein [Candidatus Parcubacteria bacterium]
MRIGVALSFLAGGATLDFAMSDTEKTLSWTLKIGLLVTPFLVFVVTRSLYFPFITGKNFLFRVLIELLAVVWVYAAFRFPRFRPRSSTIAWAVLAFLIVMGAATAFGISPYHSFWSNFERMEGYLGILHLGLFFFLLAAAFRTEWDWRLFFGTSVVVSIATAIYGLLQLAGVFEIHQGGTRVDATFGNATYYAAYLVFNLFFILWFVLDTKNWYLRAALTAAFALELVMLYFTATRGAMLGFLGGLFVFGLLFAWSARGAARRLAFGAIGAAIALPVLFFLVRDTAFVRQSDVLSRFAAISLSETTTQSRFIIWRMAFEGWQERPIIGWGQDSFVYVFSKYYDPALWRQEPWFDRAHNVFLDWLIAGGIFGLVAYLSMYAAAAWLLWTLHRGGSMNAATFAVFGALIAAHMFQNVFVFDNLTSYLLFFAVLAYIHSFATAARGEARSSVRAFGLIPAAGAAGAAAIVVVAALWFANIQPMLAAKSILDGLRINGIAPAAGKVDSLIATFQGGLDRNTFGATEIREQAAQIATALAADQSLAEQDRLKFLQFAIAEHEAQREEFPTDVRSKVFSASLYLAVGQTAQALAVLDELFQLSDQRPQFYFIAAEAYLNANDAEGAVRSLQRAYELAPDYPEAARNYAMILILAGRAADAEQIMEDFYGTRTPAEPRLAEAYARAGDFAKAVALSEAAVAASPQSAEAHANLGAMYYRAGRNQEAIAALEEAIRLEPLFKERGEQLIDQIRQGL